MSIQKLTLGIVTRVKDNSVKLRIIKSEGMGFVVDPPDVDNIDSRMETFEKYKPGTLISIYEFYSDPDYYTKMYTIVDDAADYIVNA